MVQEFIRKSTSITDACVGCGICTHNAIYLTDGEANRHARYRNMHITLQDIINANNQL